MSYNYIDFTAILRPCIQQNTCRSARIISYQFWIRDLSLYISSFVPIQFSWPNNFFAYAMKYLSIVFVQLVSASGAMANSKWNSDQSIMMQDVEIQRNNHISHKPAPNSIKSHNTPQKLAILMPHFLGDRLRTRSPVNNQQLERPERPEPPSSQPHPQIPQPTPPIDDRLPLEFLRPTRPRREVVHQNGGKHTGVRSTSSSPPSSRQVSLQPNHQERVLYQRPQLQKRSSCEYSS